MLDKLKPACTELKSLSNPPQAVKDILTGVQVFLNRKTNWLEIKKTLADLEPIFVLKHKIDRGDDFTKAVSFAENILSDPELSHSAIKRRSSAASVI